MKTDVKKYLWILFIIFIAGVFRFTGINWDSGFHLHPDERFLTMVGNAMTIPHSLLSYLDPATSSMNPANLNFSFFVYGIFPVSLNKILAVIFLNDNYDGFTLQGRFLSGLMDILTVVVIYKIVALFEKQYLHTKYAFDQSIKLWGSFFYAISVLPIQISHFFTVDTFVNFLALSSFYFALRFSFHKRFIEILLASIFFALAIASKISAIYMSPLIAASLCYLIFTTNKKKFKKYSLLFFVSFILFYLTLRISNPYLFESNNLFNPQISSLFIKNINELKMWENPDVWFPPAVQWINKIPVIFSLVNLVLFGFGIFPFIFSILGIGILLKKYSTFHVRVIIIWTIGFFLYQSSQHFQTQRYLIFIYPFLSIFSGVALSYLSQRVKRIVIYIFLFILLLWPLAFLSIYLEKNTRISASEWIYKKIPNKSVLLIEHWDDPLPLLLPNQNKNLRTEQINVFDPDTPEKWLILSQQLKDADYLILASNRGWGSMPTVPKKYPKMTKFYKDLFANRLSYKQVATFNSYPSLHYLFIPITIKDDHAEESFTVYDHPKVIIFKKTK